MKIIIHYAPAIEARPILQPHEQNAACQHFASTLPAPHKKVLAITFEVVPNIQ